jgi:hypothetical protein
MTQTFPGVERGFRDCEMCGGLPVQACIPGCSRRQPVPGTGKPVCPSGLSGSLSFAVMAPGCHAGLSIAPGS